VAGKSSGTATLIISFSISFNNAVLYPELSELIDSVNNSDPPHLLSPPTDATDVCYTCDDSYFSRSSK
jgi:hypothetical protein